MLLAWCSAYVVAACMDLLKQPCPSNIQGHTNLKQAAMRDAPVLPVFASKATHVAIQVLQEEASGCSFHTYCFWLGKKLDEGYNVGCVYCVCLLHNWSHCWIDLHYLCAVVNYIVTCTDCCDFLG